MRQFSPKHFTAFCIVLFTGYTIVAQTKPATDKKGIIYGKVTDLLSKAVVEYASVAVFTKEGKRPVNGATTDTKGSFTVSGLDTGSYRIVVDFIGYQPDTITASISGKQMTVKLPEVQLAKKSQTLQSVVVVAQKPL